MQFIPVAPEDIPNFKESHRGRVSYPILKSFLETQMVVAQLDRTGMQNSMMALTSCLNSYIKNHHLPVKVFQRGGELYLMRTDIDDDGNFVDTAETTNANRLVNSAVAATPINAAEVETRFAQEVGQVTK